MSVKVKDVFAVSDRGEEGKSYWSKIGVAFVNKDDSLNVVLDCVPMTGRIHIRDRSVNQTQLKERTNENFQNTHHDSRASGSIYERSVSR